MLCCDIRAGDDSKSKQHPSHRNNARQLFRDVRKRTPARKAARPRRRRGVKRLAVALAAMVVAALTYEATPAQAQSLPPPPVRIFTDANEVDVSSGALRLRGHEISVGEVGRGGLSYSRTYDHSVTGWRDNLTGGINSAGTIYTVTLFGVSETFALVGGNFQAGEGQGSTLTFDSGANTYTYTARDGSIAIFSKALAGSQPTQANEGRITSFTAPSGHAVAFTYRTLSAAAQRLQSVNNNFGYQIKFEYQNNDPATGGLTLLKVTAINNAVDYCDPSADTCSGFTQTWPSLSFNAAQPTTVTDSLGRTTTYTYTNNRITGIRRPTSAVDNVTIGYNGGRVSSVSNGAATWTYLYSFVGPDGTRTITRIGPSGSTVVTIHDATNTVTRIRDELSRFTNFSYDGLNRPTRIVQAEGNYTEFTYDARGNVVQATEVAKPGSGLANIVRTWSFPANCTDPGITIATCNQPTSFTDARGFRTDFTYDASHGGLLTETAPAPSGSPPVGSGVRPQVRHTYEPRFAWYKTSSGGGVAQAPTAVALLTQISSCATTGSCDGAADETETNISYGSAGTANNLLPTSVTVRSGNGSLSATNARTYDAVGNLLTIDGPLSGSADTVRHRYDAARQRVGTVGPDPDGSGALKHRAVRITYNLDGQPTSFERGTVNSQSDSDWNAFATLEQTTIEYDAVGRRVRDNLVASGATQAVVQYSYDGENRLGCTAVRMNPAVFGSLPSSACTQGTAGANGADRISLNSYDAAGQLRWVQRGVGTSASHSAPKITYSPNGLPLTVADGVGNLTTFEYDGFDRLTKIRYPTAANGAVSSTTDFEQFSYDAVSNVTQLRRRDGQLINATYDNLNRAKTTDAPAAENDLTYSYDNFGRLTAAAFTGHTLSFGYDALGRNTSQTGAHGAMTYEHDLAGRRTKATWPDGFFVTYEVDLANAVTAIRENGATALATYAYDNLGRRTSVTRTNGAVTTYGYDAASGLSTLAHNLAGSSHDVTLGFTYNPAGQALARTGNNPVYTFAPPAPPATNYVRNGLNQYSSVGGTAFSYDGRGNLTSTGAQTFGYDSFNRLTSATGGAAFVYDPIGRLYQSSAAGSTTRFGYDGPDLVAEYNASGTLLRRYVHGPSADEPAVWYEGAGTGDRRWPIADQLGSVIAVTNGSGAATTINIYDAYGVPHANNQGRFQYTGQAWLPEAGVYHYKARAYAPGIGRFLQTDPILFAGGMNFYAYVENDPVNFVDPTGLSGTGATGSGGHDTGCGGAGGFCVIGPRGGWARYLDRLETQRIVRDILQRSGGSSAREPEPEPVLPAICDAECMENSITVTGRRRFGVSNPPRPGFILIQDASLNGRPLPDLERPGYPQPEPGSSEEAIDNVASGLGSRACAGGTPLGSVACGELAQRARPTGLFGWRLFKWHVMQTLAGIDAIIQRGGVTRNPGYYPGCPTGQNNC